MSKHDESREQLARIRFLIANSVPDADHLDADTQIVPYVQGSLDPAAREIVESHLDDCALCRGEAEDLQALARRPQSKRWLTYVLAACIAGVILVLAVFIARVSTEAPVSTPRPAGESRRAAAPPTPATPRAVHGSPEWDRLVAEAVAARRLPFPLAPAGGDVLRSTGEKPDLQVSPAGTAIVETRPELRWEAREGAISVVSLYRDEREVVRSEPLHERRWRPPHPLQRGRAYTWQVEVRTTDGAMEILPAPPAPPAIFRVISDEEHRTIRTALEKYPADHLLHAVLYARAGVRDQAEAALARAAAAGDSAAKAILQ